MPASAPAHGFDDSAGASRRDTAHDVLRGAVWIVWGVLFALLGGGGFAWLARVLGLPYAIELAAGLLATLGGALYAWHEWKDDKRERAERAQGVDRTAGG